MFTTLYTGSLAMFQMSSWVDGNREWTEGIDPKVSQITQAMSTNLLRYSIYTIFAFLLILLSSCNMPGLRDSETPTSNITQAYQTVNARLTSAAQETKPSATQIAPTESGVKTATPNPDLTRLPGDPTNTATEAVKTPDTTPCDLAIAGIPIDVTIPDDTVMAPGNKFTKIWRIKNAGTCTWTTAYSVAFFSGEQMSAAANVTLSKSVSPGQVIDLAVEMTAPTETGTYQGNWKLRNAEQKLFGIGPNGNSAFWVRIQVVSTPTPTPTAPTPTSTASPTATPPIIQAKGTANLFPGDELDLDTLEINQAISNDLSYESDADGELSLSPINNAQIGRYGESIPGFNECTTVQLSSAALPLDDTKPGVYWCYRTSQGLPGYFEATNFNTENDQLTLNILTWSSP